MLGRIAQALRAREPLEQTGTRSAAVAIVLRHNDGDPEVLLQRRAEHADDPWSGHMAFPGGRRDPGDVSLYAAAVRETREEVGVDLDASECLGALDDLEAIGRGVRSGLVIRPFVFRVDRELRFALNYEVAETIWAPLEPMASGHLDSTYAWRDLELPAFNFRGREVWGLTYRMLRQLLALVPCPDAPSDRSATFRDNSKETP